VVNEAHARLQLLQRGAPPPSGRDRPTRRERDVNWGDRTRLEGRKGQTLAWVSLEESCPLIVYAHATIRSGSSICLVTIEWGNGGASIAGDYPVVKRLRVPLAASMVKVSGRLVDPSGASPSASDAADVSVFVATGLDGETLRNTRWLHQTGNAGTIAKGPQRLMGVEGYNAGSATFVQVFDGDRQAGAEPAILIPAPAGRRFRARRFDSQGFVDSVQWGASSTPLTYTADPGANVRVDAELLL
jgi:hypothetical protein